MDGVYNYYGDFSIDKSENPSFIKSDERVNLLLGLPQKIKNYEALEKDRMTDWFNTPASSPELTDGKYATNPQCFDPAWFHFTDGTVRSVMYDLGGICAVDGARVGVLKEDSTAVWPPARICVLLSENGENWQTVCELTGFTSPDSSAIIRREADFGKSYRARYVKFTFTLICHVFIDEFELFGCRNGDNAEFLVPDEACLTDFPDKFASTEQLGAKDVLLAYFCQLQQLKNVCCPSRPAGNPICLLFRRKHTAAGIYPLVAGMVLEIYPASLIKIALLTPHRQPFWLSSSARQVQ
jgi:hypothetical protein